MDNAPPDKQHRARLKQAVLDAQKDLRDSFPLKQRVAMASLPLKAAYNKVLHYWRTHAAPPTVDYINSVQLAALVELDLIVVQTKGLGCYPFSADETPLLARCSSGEKVYASCAIEVLAIPRLLGMSASIKVPCASCGNTLCCQVADNGALPKQVLDHLVITWEQGSLPVTGCYMMLNSQIRFMCASCAGWSRAQIFTLPQAIVIANTFFAFQLHPGKSADD